MILLRSLIVIALALSILCQSFSRAIVLVNYHVNKEFIAANLCENRDKPKMGCEGKCHLKKELAKEEKKEQAPSGNMKEKHEVWLAQELPNLQQEEILHAIEHHFSYSARNLPGFVLPVFHPPVG